VVAEQEQARRHGLDQALEVLEGIVAGAAHVGRGEEAEDVFGGFGKFPELWWYVSTINFVFVTSIPALSEQLTEAQ
jgi:hypothetical protein